MKKQRGITLIALIIAIIVMLILIVVSSRIILDKGGPISTTKGAIDKDRFITEKQAIETALATTSLKNELREEMSYVGTKLYDKTFVNGDKWNLIVYNNEIYGDGWLYIQNGSDDGTDPTDIDGYGPAKYNWLINENTDEVIALDEYSNYNKNKFLPAPGYIIAMDSANLNKGQSEWGDNITLRYFDDVTYNTKDKCKAQYKKQKQNGPTVEDFTEEDGSYDRQIEEDSSKYIDQENGAFKFTGNNYMEVTNPYGFDFLNGFTFEFYGQLNGGRGVTQTDYQGSPMVSIWNGVYEDYVQFRSYYYNYGNHSPYMVYALATKVFNSPSQYGSLNMNNTYPHWQGFVLDWEKYTDIYLTITIEVDNENNKVYQKFYVNGELVKEGTLTKTYYKYFTDRSADLKYMAIGRINMNDPGNWCYLNGICYATRIYNRGLTPEEVASNYHKTVNYRRDRAIIDQILAEATS